MLFGILTPPEFNTNDIICPFPDKKIVGQKAFSVYKNYFEPSVTDNLFKNEGENVAYFFTKILFNVVAINLTIYSGSIGVINIDNIETFFYPESEILMNAGGGDFKVLTMEFENLLSRALNVYAFAGGTNNSINIIAQGYKFILKDIK